MKANLIVVLLVAGSSMIAAPRGKATHIAPKLQLMPTCPAAGCGQHPAA